MKPILNFYPKSISKSFKRTSVLLLATLTLTMLLVSCTADEIEVQPKTKTAKDVYFQKNDSILSAPNTNTTTTNPTTPPNPTDTGVIVPPTIPNPKP